MLAALLICTVFVGYTGKADSAIDNGAANCADASGKIIDESGALSGKSQTGKTTTVRAKTACSAVKTQSIPYSSDTLGFTPVVDLGADYTVKGKVKIAVDTVRPTDYQAMFAAMQQMYPRVEITLDKWTHSTNDDGREYLVRTMKTGTAADIMWDEAGEMPRYIKAGWVRQITDYVNADPEASNIPANLKADYTFGGALFAVPHQATFELTAVNTTLYEQLGGKASDLEKYRNHPWSWGDYCNLLDLGAYGFAKGICVATDELFSSHHRYAWYVGSDSAAKHYSILGLNINTYTFEDGLFCESAKEFRRLRIKTLGVEGWYTAQQGLLSQIGYSGSYSGLWKAGKALVTDTTTSYAKCKNLKFDYITMPTPSKNGNLMMHVDHCFITSNCSRVNLSAAFQLLRFMTYSTNGNLARLSMYEPENAGMYNLNHHIYYPTTNSKVVAEKFNGLVVADVTDKYLFANIKNSNRYDAYKIISDYRDNYNKAKIPAALNEITDGKDTGGSSLNEAIFRFNKLSVQSVKDFNAAVAEVKERQYRAAAAAPAAPSIESKTADGFTLVATDGFEYSLDGVVWQKSNVFSNLTPGKAYTVYQRVTEFETGYASEASEGTVVRLCTLGDLDGDEEITDWDGVLLARYLAGWNVDISNADALDIDGDGEITDWDGVLLDRYLAGWDIKIG